MIHNWIAHRLLLFKDYMKVEYSLIENNYDLIEEVGIFLTITGWSWLGKSSNLQFFVFFRS
jgi:hypothetical protein